MLHQRDLNTEEIGAIDELISKYSESWSFTQIMNDLITSGALIQFNQDRMNNPERGIDPISDILIAGYIGSRFNLSRDSKIQSLENCL